MSQGPPWIGQSVRILSRFRAKCLVKWVIRGTRVIADGVIANAEDGYTAEQIADQIFFGLPVDKARRVIAYARAQGAHVPSAA